MLLGDAAPSLWVSLGALFVVLVMASVGQAMLPVRRHPVRDQITWQPIRAVDAVGGAVLSRGRRAAGGLDAGRRDQRLPDPGISPQVRDSQVLVAVNEVMPVQAQQALRSFDDVVGSSFFPRYLEPFAHERIVRSRPPTGGCSATPTSATPRPASSRSAATTGAAAASRAPASSTPRRPADDQRPRRRRGDRADGAGRRRRRSTPTVVYYNPDVDVAVIDVPGLDGPTIRFDLDGKERQQGAVLGYPQDGPFDAQPVRIRGDQRLRSPDIYGNGTVTRHVFSLRGTDPAGQLRRPARLHRGPGARRGLRGLGQRPPTPATPSPPTRSARRPRPGLAAERRGRQRQLRVLTPVRSGGLERRPWSPGPARSRARGPGPA